jgi:hypothetical protein
MLSRIGRPTGRSRARRSGAWTNRVFGWSSRSRPGVGRATGHRSRPSGRGQPSGTRVRRPLCVGHGPLDVGLLQVPVHQLVDRRSGAGRTPLIDLGKEACACLLRVGRSSGSGRDRLGQPDLPAGHRVDAGVHLNPQGAAGKRLHRPARSPPRTSSGTRHGARQCHFAPHMDPRQNSPAVAQGVISHKRTGQKVVLRVPPAGFEPATPALGERCSIP